MMLACKWPLSFCQASSQQCCQYSPPLRAWMHSMTDLMKPAFEGAMLSACRLRSACSTAEEGV